MGAMQFDRSLRGFVRESFFALAALALLLRIALPLGVMPGGGQRLILCTGKGLVTTTLPDPHPSSSHQHKPCPFAIAAAAAAQPHPPAIARIGAVYLLIRDIRSANQHFIGALVRTVPPARAPPGA